MLQFFKQLNNKVNMSQLLHYACVLWHIQWFIYIINRVWFALHVDQRLCWTGKTKTDLQDNFRHSSPLPNVIIISSLITHWNVWDMEALFPYYALILCNVGKDCLKILCSLLQSCFMCRFVLWRCKSCQSLVHHTTMTHTCTTLATSEECTFCCL